MKSPIKYRAMRTSKCEELALRLFVAYASTIWGYAGMDRLLKKLRKERIGAFWITLAQRMLTEVKSPPKIR